MELVNLSLIKNQLRRAGDSALMIGQQYLKSVQKTNLSAVNEALNEIYIEDEDYESLRESIDNFSNFDMICLASKISSHELLEFRRISAYVYRCNKKWSQSIELSKNDRMWKDAVDTANESADAAIIESLLRFFCSKGEKECFCAALYTCYSHISPDVVLELGWLNGYHNFVIPYFIQNLKQTHDRLLLLEERTAPPEEDENAQDAIANTFGGLSGGFGNVLMIENGGGMMNATGSPHSFNGAPDMSGFATVQVPSPQNGYGHMHNNLGMGMPSM
mmetsp:Transcript_8377/g.18304  ORF Transcript_8377/g.18304 Transcript_8377/m.18304 type:complete len:275 (-) Transcript_8377:97-921(-)